MLRLGRLQSSTDKHPANGLAWSGLDSNAGSIVVISPRQKEQYSIRNFELHIVF